MILKYNIDIFDSSTRKQSSEFIADLIGFPETVNILFSPGGNFNQNVPIEEIIYR